MTPLEIKAYQNFLTENHIQVAALEFIRDAQGKMYTYDVNTNTNYNPDAEQESNTYAMLELASYLKKKLAQENTSN